MENFKGGLWMGYEGWVVYQGENRKEHSSRVDSTSPLLSKTRFFSTPNLNHITHSTLNSLASFSRSPSFVSLS